MGFSGSKPSTRVSELRPPSGVGAGRTGLDRYTETEVEVDVQNIPAVKTPIVSSNYYGSLLLNI